MEDAGDRTDQVEDSHRFSSLSLDRVVCPNNVSLVFDRQVNADQKLFVFRLWRNT